MLFTKKIKNELISTAEYRAEFNKINVAYNNKAASILSIITIILLSFSITTGIISSINGAEGIDEFWVVLPLHLSCVLISTITVVILRLLRKKNLSHHWVSDFVSLIQMCLLMGFILISAHIEIPVIGIKNINVIILVMFSIGFFIRFRLMTTLILEASYVIISVVFLIFEKDDISNFYPSLVNLIASGAIASCSAYMYWKSRIDNYINMQNLQKLAMFDKLTRIHNRGSFDVLLQSEWDKAYNDGTCIALFIVDVDNFKNFNDTYGHIEGDKCLSVIADVLSQSVRKNDVVARYGGEEFAVILPGVNPEVAERIAGKMQQELHNRKIPHSNSVTPYVTFSIGCMICRPHINGLNINQFMTMADNALYIAKNSGRNKFAIHPDALMD